MVERRADQSATTKATVGTEKNCFDPEQGPKEWKGKKNEKKQRKGFESRI